MTDSTRWRVHAVLDGSVANGPGRRYVIWVQGCTLACPGCFNPETHDVTGDLRAVREVADQALKARVEGVTLTGGEPLQQPKAVAEFCRLMRAAGLGIVILTGYTRREIEADPVLSRAVQDADLVVSGRYNAALHLANGLRGSSNKEYWPITDRYAEAELTGVPEVEINLSVDGMVTVTGTPVGEWR